MTTETEAITKQGREFLAPLDALHQCTLQFRLYEQLHRAKPDHTKADTNAEFAAMCERSIAGARQTPPASDYEELVNTLNRWANATTLSDDLSFSSEILRDAAAAIRVLEQWALPMLPEDVTIGGITQPSASVFVVSLYQRGGLAFRGRGNTLASAWVAAIAQIGKAAS